MHRWFLSNPMRHTVEHRCNQPGCFIILWPTVLKGWVWRTLKYCYATVISSHINRNCNKEQNGLAMRRPQWVIVVPTAAAMFGSRGVDTGTNKAPMPHLGQTDCCTKRFACRNHAQIASIRTRIRWIDTEFCKESKYSTESVQEWPWVDFWTSEADMRRNRQTIVCADAWTMFTYKWPRLLPSKM